MRGARASLLSHLGSDCPADLSALTELEPSQTHSHNPMHSNLNSDSTRPGGRSQDPMHPANIINATQPSRTHLLTLTREGLRIERVVCLNVGTLSRRVNLIHEPTSTATATSAAAPVHALNSTWRDADITTQISAINGSIDELARRLTELARLTQETQESEGDRPA